MKFSHSESFECGGVSDSSSSKGISVSPDTASAVLTPEPLGPDRDGVEVTGGRESLAPKMKN